MDKDTAMMKRIANVAPIAVSATLLLAGYPVIAVAALVAAFSFRAAARAAQVRYISASSRRGTMFILWSSWNSSLHAYGSRMSVICSPERQFWHQPE